MFLLLPTGLGRAFICLEPSYSSHLRLIASSPYLKEAASARSSTNLVRPVNRGSRLERVMSAASSAHLKCYGGVTSEQLFQSFCLSYGRNLNPVAEASLRILSSAELTGLMLRSRCQLDADHPALHQCVLLSSCGSVQTVCEELPWQLYSPNPLREWHNVESRPPQVHHNIVSGESCCSYVPHVMTDSEVDMVPVSTTTVTSPEGPAKRKPISGHIIRPWERFTAMGRHRKIGKDLAFCFQQSHTRMNHQSMFLGVLRVYHPTLPRDLRTLMGTPRGCSKRHIDPGLYVHFGLEKALLHHFSSPNNRYCTVAPIQLDIDGVSPFNASKTQVWPILGRIVSPFKTDPFIVGIYCGPSKPCSVAEYLLDCTNELRHLLRDGP
ncbi:hypothetical protein PHET_04365 [Paragonimus heterotremus]|uniref:Uncharacterized protein n=1 Tax=Paragonimus heterotremus TaxID=100268 RepID=A0A8J4T9L3_9TREM|nr:hypothetical protein PHET_04365 [Paragonimus heterotremus]